MLCCILYAVCCMLYTVCCMLYAVLFTKIMQLPEFMHLRAFLVCVFTVRAANVWGLGMGRARADLNSSAAFYRLDKRFSQPHAPR